MTDNVISLHGVIQTRPHQKVEIDPATMLKTIASEIDELDGESRVIKTVVVALSENGGLEVYASGSSMIETLGLLDMARFHVLDMASPERG